MSERWFEELVSVAKETEAQERTALDERWERLAAGTLDADELAALRAEAEQTEEGRAAWEAFRPLGDAFQAAVVAKIQAQASPPAPVVHSRRTHLPLYVVGGLLAAGLAAFALLRPFLNPALAGYTLSSNTGERGGEGVVAGRPATLALQPDASKSGRVTVQCVVTPSGEGSRFWPGCESHLDVRPDGVLFISLPATTTAELRPGTLRVLVGRPGRFPAPTESRTADPQGRWQAFELPVLPNDP